MMTAIPENAIASPDNKKIGKSPWHESELDQAEKSVEEAWKEQFALISACSDKPPSEESSEEGKRAAESHYEELIQWVKEMKNDGTLEKSLEYLAAAQDAPPKDPNVIVQVAQLLCIMDKSVYMRDLKAEKKVKERIDTYKGVIRSALDNSQGLSDDTLTEIKDAAAEMDPITQKINEVASQMGLKYVPLCNFTSYGQLLANGPYCGAFYREPQNGDNGFIVIAFKGTGNAYELARDAMFKLVSAKDRSPLRGQCHQGFFEGFFKELPSEISVHKTIGNVMPFRLLKNQLWRLAEQMINKKSGRKVQVWITGHSLGGAYATHCWQSLLATCRVNLHDENRTIRDLFTFGSPRVGDRVYARYPNKIATFQRSWRFVHEKDYVAKLPLRVRGMPYYHLDRKVEISPQSILFRENKYNSPEEESTEIPEGRFLAGKHSLKSYWESLRKAKVVTPWNSGEESESDKILPPDGSLITWSLEEFHRQEYVESIGHPEHAIYGQESVSLKDQRQPVRLGDYEDGGTFRSVVKIQSLFFPPGYEREGVWTMGTGWLIRKDLIVTAGHNVYSQTYGGQAKRIKCWVGYRGRKEATDNPNVQYRKALNIVTTKSWFRREGDRRRDVALIQVSVPFEGNLNLFTARNTDTKVSKRLLTVVGYPGDMWIEDPEPGKDPDYGAMMYQGAKWTSYDLENPEGERKGMIEYQIDTYGGQSGAPILLETKDAPNYLIGIGTHCYGAGGANPRNSGNAIGGSHGNDYEKFIMCLEGSNENHPTPVGTIQPDFVPPDDLGGDGGENILEGGEESFWAVFKTVAKIGSVALPSAGAFMGPAGILLGTVAGGVLGSLAESIASGTQHADVQDRCIKRAQMAEAALQSVIRLGRSPLSNDVFSRMEKVWRANHFRQIPQLADLVSPVLGEYGFLIAADHWEKKVEPNPEARKLLDKKVPLAPPGGCESSTGKAGFVRALCKETKQVEGIPDSGEESLPEWLPRLIEDAIIKANPLVTEAAKKALEDLIRELPKSPAESFPTGDKPEASFGNIIRRAAMADCALQVIETLSEEELGDLMLSPTDAGHEEGIIDSIKTRAQKLGPVALRYAKSTIRKYLPLLLRQLEKKISDNTANKKPQEPPWSVPTSVASISSFQIPRSYVGDDNPDAPLVEPRPPASPTAE